MKKLSSIEDLRTKFKQFSQSTKSSSPLYSHLSQCVSSNDYLLTIVGQVINNNQPPTNLLFAAVHFLLLEGKSHPLKHYYPSITDDARNNFEGLCDNFINFCKTFETELKDLIRNRYVQTNEVGRCRAILPALNIIEKKYDKPLSVIEIGTSAGLNLCFDQYNYLYRDSTNNRNREIGPVNSTLKLECPFYGDIFENLPKKLPTIIERFGIDKNPLDISVRSDRIWLKSLIWPDQPDRIKRFDRACEIAINNEYTLFKGDASVILDEVIQASKSNTHLVIFQTFVYYMLDRDQITTINELLKTHSMNRDISFISLRWIDPPKLKTILELTTYSDGELISQKLAETHFHADWINMADALD